MRLGKGVHDISQDTSESMGFSPHNSLTWYLVFIKNVFKRCDTRCYSHMNSHVVWRAISVCVSDVMNGTNSHHNLADCIDD